MDALAPKLICSMLPHRGSSSQSTGTYEKERHRLASDKGWRGWGQGSILLGQKCWEAPLVLLLNSPPPSSGACGYQLCAPHSPNSHGSPCPGGSLKPTPTNSSTEPEPFAPDLSQEHLPLFCSVDFTKILQRSLTPQK